MEDRRYALLVEDELLVAMAAAEVLEELGFQVLEAGTAARALDLAKAHTGGGIAFAMVDLGLPDLPGEELIRQLRVLDPALPIIIATGKGPGAIDAAVRSLHNLTIVTKPYDFEDLRIAVELYGGRPPAA
jgi:DNA-binding response OmpR family regulator